MVGGGTERWLSPVTANWLEFLLATPIVFWAGWPFLERGVRSVVNRRLNMFTLIAMGVAAAYGYSCYQLIGETIAPPAHDGVSSAEHAEGGHAGGSHLYFESAATITVLVLLGQVLELRARGQTTAAIRELFALAPPVARRIDGDRAPCHARCERRRNGRNAGDERYGHERRGVRAGYDASRRRSGAGSLQALAAVCGRYRAARRPVRTERFLTPFS